MKSKNRKPYIVKARKLYFFIAAEITKNSFRKIGYGIEKNHSTVIHHLNKIREGIVFDDRYKRNTTTWLMTKALQIIKEFE